MKKLTFSYNWNKKLYARFFTTIRINKDNYWSMSDMVQVFLQQRFIYRAKIHKIIDCFLDQLPELTAIQDTGMSREETIALIRKMYPQTDFTKQKVSIMLLENLEWEAPNKN